MRRRTSVCALLTHATTRTPCHSKENVSIGANATYGKPQVTADCCLLRSEVLSS